MPDQISVSEFVSETNEDYKSPTASNFTTRMAQCRNTVAAIEEVRAGGSSGGEGLQSPSGLAPRSARRGGEQGARRCLGKRLSAARRGERRAGPGLSLLPGPPSAGKGWGALGLPLPSYQGRDSAPLRRRGETGWGSFSPRGPVPFLGRGAVAVSVSPTLPGPGAVSPSACHIRPFTSLSPPSSPAPGCVWLHPPVGCYTPAERSCVCLTEGGFLLKKFEIPLAKSFLT
uniref:ArfGAP with SH3 domain, ankyrin repeat and PH domain 2 n=1 Tax=Gopherus agassizii TaxID=38772 RepID=A0A452HKJ9_9SAUR